MLQEQTGWKCFITAMLVGIFYETESRDYLGDNYQYYTPLVLLYMTIYMALRFDGGRISNALGASLGTISGILFSRVLREGLNHFDVPLSEGSINTQSQF